MHVCMSPQQLENGQQQCVNGNSHNGRRRGGEGRTVMEPHSVSAAAAAAAKSETAACALAYYMNSNCSAHGH